MPAAVAIVGAIVAGATLAVTVIAQSAILSTIALMALDAGVRKLFGAKPPSIDTDLMRAVTLKSAIEHRTIIYGEVATGGVLNYFNASGTDNKDLWTVVAYAGHHCNDMTAIFLDDRFISAADISSWSEGSTGKTVEAGDYFIDGQGYVKLYKHLGGDAQTANTALIAAVAEWTDTEDGEQVGYGIIKLTIADESQKIFENGSPQNFRALWEGKDNIYDPLLQYVGGTVTQSTVDQSNPSFQAYTTNPILATSDYCVDARVGFSIPAARINWQTILDEAAYCDRQVATSTTDVTENRFTCNALLSTGNAHDENILSLLTACNGRMGYKNGLFFIRAGRYGVGPTLIDNGTFPDTTGWTKQGNGTMAAPSGQLLLTNTAGGNVMGVTPVTTVVGNIYALTAWSRTSSNEADNYQLLKSDNADGSAPDVTNTITTEDAQLRIEFAATATTSYIGLKLNSTTDTLTAEFDDVEMYLVSETLVDESWMRDDLGVYPSLSKDARFNNARGFYSSRDEQWKKVEAMEVRNTAFESRDNSERIYESFDLPATNHEDEAQRILHKLIQQTDEQKTIQMPCNYKALQVAVHDFVHVSIAELNFASKVFRVVNIDIAENDGVDLTLTEDSIDGYQDPDLADYTTRTPGGISFGSFEVPDPTAATVTAKEGGNLVEWVSPVATYYDVVEVYAHTANVFGSATKIHEGRGSSFLHKLDLGELRFYWVRARWSEEFSTEVPTSPTSSQALNTLSDTATNFDGRNDRDGSAITAPVVAGDGSAIDHVVATSGDADISFEWGWGGSEPDIDGFLIYQRQSTSASSYNFGATAAEETIVSVPADRRHFFLYGVPIDKYYTFGVQAFRVVDPDVAASGLILTSIIQPALGSEDPFQPASSVAFSGDVTGTVNSIDAAVVTAGAALGDTSSQATGVADNADVTIDNTMGAVKSWVFTSDNDEWVPAGATLTHQGDGTTLYESTSTDPKITSQPDLVIEGAADFKLRARVKRKAGSNDNFICFYSTSGHGFSGSFIKTITTTTVIDEFIILEWDMSDLTAGGNDWITNTITRLRIDLGTTTSDDFVIDWISVGRDSSPAATINTKDLLGDTFDLSGNFTIVKAASLPINLWQIDIDGSTPVSLASNTTFTFDEAGTYLVSFALAGSVFPDQGTNDDEAFLAEIWIEVDAGGGFTRIAGGDANEAGFSPTNSATSRSASWTATRIIDASAGDDMKIMTRGVLSSGTVASSTSYLSILKLEQIRG